MIDAAAAIAAQLQTYMLIRFGMSVLTGFGFWVFAVVDGLELQREWGAGAEIVGIRFRSGLFAGGKWIRTIGPPLDPSARGMIGPPQT